MPEERAIEVYTFKELSETPQEIALGKIAEQIQYWRNDSLYEQFADKLREWGFPTEKIEWSLGYSQGDGVAFYGPVDVETYCKKVGIDSSPFEGEVVTITRNQFGVHYSHFNTMDVVMSFNDEEFERQIIEDIRTVSKEMEVSVTTG